MIRMIRLAATSLGVGGIIAAVLRLRSGGGVPPQSGGWRELHDTELD